MMPSQRRTSRAAQAALLSLSLLLVPQSAWGAPQPRASPSVCNLSADLCNRSYGNITFVGAHDSYAVGSASADNQDYPVTQQLTDGIRLLQNQAQNSGGTIELCHTSCELEDGGSLSAYLTSVKSWVDSNPNDVVTILLVNIDNLAVSAFDSVYKSVGLDTLSYVPPSASLAQGDWPTLGAMISAGTRVVTFMDNGADFTTVPYIIDEFSNVWETAFDVTSPTFDCAVNRTTGDSTTQMYLINHFLDTTTSLLNEVIFVPDHSALPTTNAASGSGSLGEQAAECIGEYGRAPNFMLVDFYEVGGGSVFDVAAALNGVSYSPTASIAAVPTSTSTGSGGAQESSVPLNGAVGGVGAGWQVWAAVMVGVLAGAWSVV